MLRARFRAWWLRKQRVYEKKALGIFQSKFKNIARKIPFNFIENAEIDNYINISDFYNTYYHAYIDIGSLHGVDLNKVLNKDLKLFDDVLFLSEYQKTIFTWIVQNIGFRIVSVKQEFVEYIKGIITQAYNEGLTTREMALRITEFIDSREFYRWQALRIARTETTTIANFATIMSVSNSNLVYEKTWISALDARTRRRPKSFFDHREMNGVKVDIDKPFNVNGELIDFPGAPFTQSGNRTSAGNVINCRCTIALTPKRDRQGRLIRKR